MVAARNPNVAELEFSFRHGHSFNPKYPNLRNLDLGRVRKMNGAEKDAHDLMASWQEIDYNVELLVAAIHTRRLEADGFIGKASETVLNFNRCPLPDYMPGPGDAFDFGDPEVNDIVANAIRSKEAAVGLKGPYWRGCDPQHPDIHSVVIGIDAKNAPSVFMENMDKILEARVACAAEIGVHVRFVINPTSMEGLQQYQVYRNIPGGVIGMNYFPSSNSCGKIPNGSMDSSYNPSDWRLHANLGTHESEGHGFGFEHTRGGIMNPSIVLVWPLSWKGDTGWTQASRYYPAVPLEPTPGPGPGPGPTPLPPSSVPNLILEAIPGGLFQAKAKKNFTAKAGDIVQKFYIAPEIIP
jgi:hypothetical protein